MSESEYAGNQFAFQRHNCFVNRPSELITLRYVRLSVEYCKKLKVEISHHRHSYFEDRGLGFHRGGDSCSRTALPKLKQGMVARLSRAIDDQLFEGFVSRISPVVDADAGTVKVVVGLEPWSIGSGMWVKVELVLDRKSLRC